MPLKQVWSSCLVCLVCGSASFGQIAMQRVATGLSDPVFVTHAPGDFDRLFIVEQGGRIKILKNGSVLPTPFLDITDRVNSGGERGLLGLTFHPSYQTNGLFFVDYTGALGTTNVAQFSRTANFDVADASSEVTLLTVPQPFSNHNGGWIDFGPDGYLYISLGDGGNGNDPGNRAQDITNQFLGKMLRIDVDGDDFPGDAGRNYAIPADNPFVGVTADDEIWAYGLRNAWRCSFDDATGDLYMADVGQSAREEIDFHAAGAPAGQNYGWRCTEGTSCTGLSGCVCNGPLLTPPIHEYDPVLFNCTSVTGGYVYRGCAMPDLVGTYFFADFCRDQMWSFRYSGGVMTEFAERTSELAADVGTVGSISSFGEDAYGELYVCDLFGGEVFKMVPSSGITDCNTNGISDACDIDRGTSFDNDGNGIPDECFPPVPAMSTYGAICLAIALLIMGTFVLRRRSDLASA